MKRPFLVLALLVTGCSGAPDSAPPSDPRPAAFDYEFLNFVGGANPSVLVKIRKDDPDHGVVMWSAVHRPGDTLGWSMEFGIPSSTHLVLSARKGKAVYADFDTGVVIDRIVANNVISRKVQECPILWRPMANCPGPRSAISADRVDEVHCKERSGEAWVHQRGTILTKAGALCGAHGGNGVPRWSKEEFRQRLESEAASHLAEADASWGSRNPKTRTKARDTYRRLVKDYGSIELVIKNLDRIKPRSEAEIEE